MTRQIKKSLNTVLARWYFFTAATVLAVGHTTPDLSTATSDAASVFFVVVTVYAMMRHFMVRCYPTGAVANLSYGRGWITPTTMSMVAQAGPTSVGPVSVDAGSGIPVWAIASEHTTSCDSSTSCQRRLPQWLQSKSAQNSRSPNSVVTVVAAYTVRRWLRCILTFSASLIIPVQLIFVSRTYCLTSTMILRL
ncbi:ash family protein [Escherichia coli]